MKIQLVLTVQCTQDCSIAWYHTNSCTLDVSLRMNDAAALLLSILSMVQCLIQRKFSNQGLHDFCKSQMPVDVWYPFYEMVHPVNVLKVSSDTCERVEGRRAWSKLSVVYSTTLISAAEDLKHVCHAVVTIYGRWLELVQCPKIQHRYHCKYMTAKISSSPAVQLNNIIKKHILSYTREVCYTMQC